MPATTPCVNIPYPLGTDPIDVNGDMQRLAEQADSAICAITGKYVGEVFVMYVPSGTTFTPPEETLLCDGAAFNTTTYPALAAYLGASTTPDLRERFLRMTGGDFPTNGTLGGSADAINVSHTHSVNAHTHSIAHDHGAFNATGGSHNHTMSHNHGAATTSTSGNHQHVGASALAVLQYGGGNLGIADGAVWGGVYGAPLNLGGVTTVFAGSHSHTFDVPNYSGNTGTTTSHTHSINVPNYTGNSGSASSGTGTAGQSGDNKNLPPYVNVQYLIQAA